MKFILFEAIDVKILNIEIVLPTSYPFYTL